MVAADAGLATARPIYCAIMPEPPDLANLAKRYVDLWQDQLSAMAADPELAESMARLFAALVPPAWARWPGAARNEAAAPAGAAATGTPSHDGDGGVAEFARRLAAVEERLAALESGAHGNGAGTRSKRRPRRA
jgi:hypothetical protein